jgi:DNA-binding NtrC family response regulator
LKSGTLQNEGKIMEKMRKVLVVDDEEIVRLSHMRTLAGQSCDVEAARGVAEALEKMQKEPADVVLMDLRMPGMDGLAGLKTVKERWPATEVVIITGYPSVYTAREAVRLGAFDYLVKPVGPDQIVAVANAAMAQSLAPPQGKKAGHESDTQKGWAKYVN